MSSQQLDPAPDAAKTPSIRSISPSSRSRSFTRLETLSPSADPLQTSLHRLRTETSTEDLRSTAEEEDEDEIQPELPEDLDKLSPELIQLCDSFLTSLRKPIHPTPPNITDLAGLFQQFYTTASGAISTHLSNTFLSLSSKARSQSQLLSRAEIAQKKRDRKLLESKRVALEEAVERRVTEGIYSSIFRHRSTDDDARDDSLHSKIAALKVVGVKLGHLGVDLPEGQQESVDREIQAAGKILGEMNAAHYPLGKLLALKRAHKTIVDCLTTHLSTTSADSLLPALIYTLLLAPLPLNAVSNLLFVQRFRNITFMDGEASYCLTNLEAAISFLETVDLATLKISPSDSTTPVPVQLPPPVPASSSPIYPPAPNPLENLTAKLNIAAATHSHSRPTSAASDSGKRFPTPIDIANTAVLTADQQLRSLGTALESSYKFLFERRREEAAPRTLEDARKLVSDTPVAGAGYVAGPAGPVQTSTSPSPAAAAAGAALDPFKTLGNSLGRFAHMGMSGFRRTSTREDTSPSDKIEGVEQRVLSEDFPEVKELAGGQGSGHVTRKSSQASLRPVSAGRWTGIPVNEKFLKTEVADLRLGDVQELLMEYKRLVLEVRRREGRGA